jgi:hypothetical protein
MIRSSFISHLEDEGCFHDEDFIYEYGQMYRNSINGEFCVVPYEDPLEVTTFCHIIHELRIDPPLEVDSFYHVYQGFRSKLNEIE